MAACASIRCVSVQARGIRSIMQSSTARRFYTDSAQHPPTIKAFRGLQTPTGQRVASYCRARNLPHHAHRLDPVGRFPSATLHQVDADSDQSHGALLFFHGGGYTHPASHGHLELGLRLVANLNCRWLYILEYTLLPDGKYPTQLAQATTALRDMLRDHDPSEILIGGDSAGGNLTLGLLAHLYRPHPDIPPLKLEQHLKGAICISPRCSNSTDAPSFTTNAKVDILDARACAYYVDQWEPVPGEVWAAANNGGPAFWRDREGIRAKKMFIVVGDRECYFDDIETFAGMIGASKEGSDNADVEFAVAEGAAHVQAVLDLSGGKTDGTMTRALLDWASRNRLE